MPVANITPNPAIVCSGASLSLNGNPSGGSGIFSNHIWSGTGVGFLSATNIANPTFNAPTVGVQTTYSLNYSVTDNVGCQSTLVSITVTVNPNDIATVANIQACQDGNIYLPVVTGVKEALSLSRLD
ncbi:MAG: hypothetical protein IPG85_18300 [Bacteroidetes bacterium]|nr:hypothetical protein [Bacteroidota bacterium]